ncbi:MFS transporter [Methylovirgula sp. 4M-Z18]|uniref:MFS transporter n=1 Tax=Methylovirgula sp. 4M-Z18 TaxID=2293567 RepID=UPI0018F470AE|nr:MFS transporter [Methylovirgula sp. 4M-Z18]
MRNPTSSYRWTILAVATLTQASASFLVQGFGALAGYIKADLGLSGFEIGLLMSSASVAPIFGLLVVGELLDRFNERWIVGVGSLVIALASGLASLAGGYVGLLFCLILLGAGYSTAQPGGAKSIAVWFERAQRGFAMGIRQAGLPLGGALSVASLPVIAARWGWHSAFFASTCVALFGGVLFLVFYRAPDHAENFRAVAAAPGGPRPPRMELLRHPSTRNIAWAGITMVSAQFAITLFLPLYLTERYHMALPDGALVLLVTQVAGVIGRIVLAAWSDRAKSGRFFPVFCCLAATTAGLLALLVPVAGSLLYLVPVAAWVGFFGIGWYGPWVAYLAEAAPPDRVGFALGLALAANQITICLSPALLGLLHDLFGSYTADWIVLAVILLAATLMTRKPAPNTVALASRANSL